MKKYQDYIVVILILTVILFILFYKLVFGDYIFASADTLAPQAIKQGIQNIKDHFQIFPYWFPYIYSGMPMIHSFLNISEYYFPHHIFSLFNHFGMPWIWSFLFHYIFSALGMYNLLRFLKHERFPAIFSAILFSISPYMIAYLVHGHGSQIMTASYIPWIILFLFKIYEKTNLFNFAILSLLVGLQLQRGHIQIAYYTWMMIGLFIFIQFLFFVRKYKKNNNSILSYTYKNLIIIFSLFVGFLTSVSVYLPVFNYTNYSTRGAMGGGFGLENATQWSLNFKEAITFIMPYSYGFGGKGYWGFLPFTDFPNYIGIIVLFLACIGLFNKNLKKEYKTFLLLSLIFSFLLSLGKHCMVVFSFFYNWFPFFDKFRAPIFILIIFQFSIYILAGSGLSLFPSLLKDKKKRRKILYGFLLIFVIMNINYFIPHNFYPKHTLKGDKQILSKIKRSFHDNLINIDLNNDNQYNDLDEVLLFDWMNHDAKLYYSYLKFQYTNQTKLDLINALKNTSDEIDDFKYSLNRDYIFIISLLITLFIVSFFYYKLSYFRIDYFICCIIILLTADYIRINYDIINPKYHKPHNYVLKAKDYIEKYLEPDEVSKYLTNDNLNKFRVLDLSGNNRNRLAAFNIETINGYHPAKLSMYQDLLTEINNKGYWPEGLLNALNVKYLIHPQKIQNTSFKIIDKSFKMNYFQNTINPEIKDFFIYEKKNFKQRLFFVDSIEFYKDEGSIMTEIITDHFSPQKKSYININDLNTNQIHSIKNLEKSNNRQLELVSWSPNEIKFKTITDKEQFVFISEIFFPGWIINDNNNIQVIRVNGLFRGIIIPKGENSFIMSFNPNDIFIGSIISKLAYIIIFIFILLPFYNRLKNVKS